MFFVGSAASHLDEDLRSDIHVSFADETFTGGNSFSILDARRSHLVMLFDTDDDWAT
ncbi:MAG: hypothetical protein ACYTGL_13765 [Planctomycetota bacterium]|jgi:hypothetical protein